MEEPFIVEESNLVRVQGSDSVEKGEGSGSKFNYLRRKLLKSRSEAITSGSKYQRAAALVDLVKISMYHLTLGVQDYDSVLLGLNSVGFHVVVVV